MRFIKYNITKGKSASGNTTSRPSAISHTPTVDLSGVYSRISEDEAAISELNRQVTQLNNIANGLESKYLRKDKNENTDYIITMRNGRGYGFESRQYHTSGIGFVLTEAGTSSSSPDSTLILSGLGNGSSQITCRSVTLDEAILNSETIYNLQVKLTCNSCFTVNNTTLGAYALIDVGFSCGNHYKIIEESLYMTETVEMQPNNAPPVTPPSSSDNYNYGIELDKIGNYWKVPITANGINTSYNFTYIVKYNYIAPNQLLAPMQAINAYIRGTNDTTTDFYGGVANKLVATPDYLQLTTNGEGLRITSLGIYRLGAGGLLTQLL